MDDIDKILLESRNIAVVGISNKLGRPSLTVASYLKGQGYRIIPVNPTIQDVNGEKSYPDLTSIPEKVDVVDIFRKPEDVLPVVEEAIRIGVKAIWMQEGIVNEEAAGKARAAGLHVVMDKCMLKEHSRLKREGRI
ncbi:MAG: CoA-binding protein [Nitrospirae bacterium]|nr:CoA-binding protein [Nitrospirota bacterium]